MIDGLAALVRPFLFSLDAETAHRLTVAALSLAPRLTPAADDPGLTAKAFGLDFPNPIGLAAGLDKNAEIPDAVLGLGFGFVEVGTLTPRPQEGNPRPRLFRLVADDGVINRLGFNNDGHAAGLARLKRRAGRPGVVGVNIGANKDALDRPADYVAGVSAFAAVASYLAVNVSSPNTPGLRDLQHEAALDDLLARVAAARDEAAARHGRTPILLKMAPDLTLQELDAVLGVARRRAVDGLIVSNTTVSRPNSLLDQAAAAEAGGLSGKPLFRLSTRMLAEAYRRLDGAFPLVGVGGVDSAEAAWIKIQAGASLLQLYTGLIYKGPALIGEIKRGLVRRLGAQGYTAIGQAVGRDADAIAREHA